MASTGKEKMIFYQDNAPGHLFRIAVDKLHEMRYELLPHPTDSSNLAHYNLFPFLNTKIWLVGKEN